MTGQRGKEREIVIARNGRPAAKLVVPDSIDVHNEEVARIFLGGQS